ncbi:MAG: YlxR family protein [Firmicutes bacterium]|nr:YlxR family protein [Bacillota bacterium]
MVKTRKIPQRSCIGCGLKTDKINLIRVVRKPNGVLVIDKKGKEPGRGAYICHNAECLKAAIRKKAIERALGEKLSDDIIVELTNQISSD